MYSMMSSQVPTYDALCSGDDDGVTPQCFFEGRYFINLKK